MQVVFTSRKKPEMKIQICIMESSSIVEVVDRDFIFMCGQTIREKLTNYYR